MWEWGLHFSDKPMSMLVAAWWFGTFFIFPNSWDDDG
jgi:hypothetical protein